MTRCVAVYCRLSPRPDGSYEGVDLQEDWGREYAASVWPGVPVEVFKDKGVSAAKGDHRPDFERFREWVAAGRIVHVWTVEQTRLERREVEWFRLAAELDAAGISEVHTKRDGIVRVRDDVAGIKAVLAAGEVRKLTQRVNDRLAENAASGQPPGSHAFGYRHAVIEGEDGAKIKTYVVVEEEAAAIRQAAEWVLAGWSLANIAAELRARGLRGAHGGELRPQSVRQMVTMPTVAGRRVHKGRIVGSGNWEPILDEQTWQACKLKLSQPRRVVRKDGWSYPISDAHRGNPTGRRYLLTGGLAVCGVCEAPMVASMKQLRGREPKPYYLCHPNKRRPNGEPAGGCIGILGLELEQHVVDRLWAELDKPEFLDAIAADEHAGRREEITAALEKLDRLRVDLAALWATPGELTDTEWRSARRGIAENERKLRTELNELPPPRVGIDIAAARAAWPDMTLDEEREFLRLFIRRVTVRRARPGTTGFDTGRVDIDWQSV
ncbi:recombinase family protein [Amycolatopsis sp. NPDC059027]|uniref:recombinase family protein n=1 Tax=Amycolatopsis sp. NPDC059027 TaxID=3346709 RepID=UPI003672BFB9